MARPVGWREDSQDTRWHSLGLLDDNIKSLKKQVELLAQELRSAVAERDQLLNELGVLQWPGLERDARFLLKLPGSVRKGNSAEWRNEAKNGRCECQNGEDGKGEECSCKQVHRRGQSWNGWENKIGKGVQKGKSGGKVCRSRIKSFDSALGIDNLPFGGDLPTHRGPAPTSDALVGASDCSVEGRESSDPNERGVNIVSNARTLLSISEADDEPTSEREDDRDPGVLAPTPDTPSTQTGSDPDRDLESPSDDPMGDPELCEDRVPELPSAPRRWLSNSAYRHNLTDSPVPPADLEDPPAAGITHHHPQVRMRTTHVALVERANRASRLSKELFQAKFALHDSQSQLQFLTERMMAYKNNFQEEVRRHEEEVQKLKGMLNDATTAKFIMFCKLSECQEKVQQLEENLVVSRAMSGKTCKGMDENIDQNNRAAINQPLMEKVDSAQSPLAGQGRVRGSSMSTIERGMSKLEQNAVGSNFQRRLTETMRRLLEAQNRGDQLQERLQELEAQLKKGGEDGRSVLSSDWSSASGSQGRAGHNRAWSGLKQARVELKRTRLQLHKCEEELNTSNKIRQQQESDLRKLRLELKEAKRRRPPKWR